MIVINFGKAAFFFVSFLSSRCIFKLLNGHNSSTLIVTGLDKIILIILIIPVILMTNNTESLIIMRGFTFYL